MRVDPKHKSISMIDSLILGVLMFALTAFGYKIGMLLN